jgi:hypothetical protein
MTDRRRKQHCLLARKPRNHHRGVTFEGHRRMNFPAHIFRFFCLSIDRRLSRRLLRAGTRMSGTHDVRQSRAFFDHEIVARNQSSKKWLQFDRNLTLSGRVVIPNSYFVSRSTQELFGANLSDGTGPQKTIPETAEKKGRRGALVPHLCLASNRPKGDGRVKDTDHPTRHPSVHTMILGSARRKKTCAWPEVQFGRVQNTEVGWSDPTFVHVSVPKAIRGVAPAHSLRAGNIFKIKHEVHESASRAQLQFGGR